MITLDNGESFNVEANWLHNQQLDYWKDWSCDAGYHRIYIDAEQDVYGGQCLNDKLGNLETGWELLPSPTICKRDRCNGCTDDLLQLKRKQSNGD